MKKAASLLGAFFDLLPRNAPNYMILATNKNE